MPQLIDLLKTLPEMPKCPKGAETMVITSITSDSRKVMPGGLFIAIPGAKANGDTYIDDAISRGASVIITSSHTERSHTLIITLPNPRLALSRFAAALYPQQPKHVVAVTGTDGKTSTAEFFRQLAELAGHNSASIGTLGTLGKNREELAPGLNTTPDPVTLHQTLSTLAQRGISHVGMEASSHGLHQYRLDGVMLSAAAFTNLTRDHLDYHVTLEAYRAAKARLFFELLHSSATAVLNADDECGQYLATELGKRNHLVTTYGKNGEHYRILSQKPTADGQDVVLSILGQEQRYSLPLYGAFQIWNALAALGLLAATGEDAQKVAALIPQLQGVPGRLERIPGREPMFVDYAHTPAALANVLKTLRPHTEKRLVVVFGCGGDRDKGKRPEMGKAAAELADLVIVTDDNPRSENPATIRKEVLAGASGAQEIGDRAEAIRQAVKQLQKGDVLVVAGKGHEKTQIIGSQTFPFDDAQVLRDAVKS